jgi:hypothetical protein
VRHDQPEAACEVVGKRVPLHHCAVIRREPDRLGFGDQVADGEHQPILSDHHAVAHALGAQDRRGEGILGNLGAQCDDGIERRLEIECDFVLAGCNRTEGPAVGSDTDDSLVVRHRHENPMLRALRTAARQRNNQQTGPARLGDGCAWPRGAALPAMQ